MIHKVLQRCFQDAVVYRLGSVETVNVTYSRFDSVFTAVRRCFVGKDAETA